MDGNLRAIGRRRMDIFLVELEEFLLSDLTNQIDFDVGCEVY